MANNVFTLLDSYQDSSIDNTDVLKVSLQKADNIIRYPLSLANTQGGIPFTLFMPYKRKSAPRAILTNADQRAELFTSFPTPDFAIALPTPTSALKTTYAADYGDVNLGQAAGVYLQSGKLRTENPDAQLRSLTTTGGFAVAGTAAAGEAAKIAGGLAQSAARNLPGKRGALLDAAGRLMGSSTGQAAAAGAAALALDQQFSSTESMVARTELAAGQALLSAIGADEGAAQVLKGATTNPFTDRLFKNVQFRPHTFSYTFLPKSEKESETIDKIIQLFKYAMLPRPHSTAGFFEFPYEFHYTLNSSYHFYITSFGTRDNGNRFWRRY